MERVLDLTLKMADEGLSPEEQEELERLIEAEPLARRRHLQVLEVEAALRAARHAKPTTLAMAPSESLVVERRVAAVLEKVRRPPLLSWRRGARARTAAVGGVAVAAAAVLLLVWRPVRHHAEGTPGAVARLGTRPSARHELVPTRGLSLAVLPIRASHPSDWISLDLGDGARLEVRGRAVLGVDRPGGDGGQRITLEDGIVSYEGSADALTTIATPQAQLLVHGGRVVVVVSAGTTRVSVTDGQATITARDGSPTKVSAHEQANVDHARAAVGPLPSAALVLGDLHDGVPAQALDQALLRRLEDLGFGVELFDEKSVRAEQLQKRSLVVISPTTTPRIHDRAPELGLLDSESPILCSRPTLFEDLGMTAPGHGAAQYTNQKKMLAIVDAEHPMAAGLHGEVEVLEANMNVGWGIPGPGAARIAVIRKSPEHSTIFAYDRDAPLVSGGRAAARRVGFFLHPTAARFMNDRAWRLFDAAVRWAAEETR